VASNQGDHDFSTFKALIWLQKASLLPAVDCRKKPTLLQPILLYLLTTIVFLLVIPILFFTHRFSITRSLILLFILDSVLTVEVADNGDIISLAALHFVTVPAFLLLVFLDVVQHHRNQFTCFLCGKDIGFEGEIVSVNRILLGKATSVNVHPFCIDPGERNALSERKFRRGIPK